MKSDTAADSDLAWRNRFCILLASLVLANLLWYTLGNHPAHWDSAIHLIESLNAHRLGEQQDISLVSQALNVSWYYPPFVSYTAIPVYALLGESTFAAFTLMLLYYILFVGGVYLLASRLLNRKTGFLAALFVSSFPIVIEFSRDFMLDLPLAAIVVLSFAALLAADGFRNLSRSLLFGALLGIGLLTKWTVIAFLLVPVIVEFLGGIRSTGRKGRILLHAFLAACIAAVIAGPWYLAHAIQILTSRSAFLTDAGGTPADAFLYYLRAIPDQTALLMLPIIAGGIFLFFVHFRTKKLSLVIWFLGGYILHSLIGFKQPRHTIALLVPLAIMAAAGFVATRRSPIVAFVAAVAILQFCAAAFIPLHSGFAEALLRPVLTHSIMIVHGPDREDWHQQDIVESIERDRLSRNRKNVSLRVITDARFCNNSTAAYAAKIRRYPFVVSGTTGFPLFTDYVLLKSPDSGPGIVDDERQRISDTVLASGRRAGGLFQEVSAFPLPDSSRAIVFRVAPHALPGFSGSELLRATRESLDRFVKKYFVPSRDTRYGRSAPTRSQPHPGVSTRFRSACAVRNSGTSLSIPSAFPSAMSRSS